MSASIKVEFPNIEEIQAKFAGAPEAMERAVHRAVSKVAFHLEGQSKILSPVDTGRLRASIYTLIDSTQAFVSTNVNYAMYVHEGTSRMTGQPFMREALRNSENTIKDIVEREFDDAVDRAF